MKITDIKVVDIDIPFLRWVGILIKVTLASLVVSVIVFGVLTVLLVAGTVFLAMLV